MVVVEFNLVDSWVRGGFFVRNELQKLGENSGGG
jgi:hypothetical protein